MSWFIHFQVESHLKLSSMNDFFNKLCYTKKILILLFTIFLNNQFLDNPKTTRIGWIDFFLLRNSYISFPFFSPLSNLKQRIVQILLKKYACQKQYDRMDKARIISLPIRCILVYSHIKEPPFWQTTLNHKFPNKKQWAKLSDDW